MASAKNRLARSKPLTAELYAETILTSGVAEPTFIAIKGPLTLCRFGRVNFGEMQCWFTQDEYLQANDRANALLGAGTSYSSTLRGKLRDRLAIRLDWNDMAKLSFLHLPADVRVEAFISVVKAQPLISEHDSSKGKRRSSKMPNQIPFLRGGGTQYWLLPVAAWLETQPPFLKGG
jgi:hypothetical protein